MSIPPPRNLSRTSRPCRRLRPRTCLRRAHCLERAGDAEHSAVVETPADDLQADRQALVAIAAVDRRGRLLGHVEGDREADMRKWVQRVVAWRGQFGGERSD